MKKHRRTYDSKGRPVMTAREKELERLVWRLRARVFDEVIGDRVERILKRANARLAGYNSAYSACIRAEADERFLFLTT
jgi:hypothetical protein